MRPRAILGVLLLGALVLRLLAIGSPLSHDEGYTWMVASAHSPGQFLDRLAAYENTPPLYYLLTWPLPDDGVAWLRLVSVLAGVGCAAAVWWAVRGRAGLIAAAAVAVAPFAVSYSDYARGFVLADAALIVALGAALRGRWWLYAVAAVAAVYAEYDSALFLIALAAGVGFERRWADAARAVAPIGALALWLPEALRTSTTKVSPIYPSPSPNSLRDSIVRLTFGEHGAAHSAGLRWLQFALVAAVAIWAFHKAPRILGVTAAGTLVLHAIVHWIGPDVFAARYMTELIPLGCMAFGYASAQMGVPGTSDEIVGGARHPRSSSLVPVGVTLAVVAVGVAVGVRRVESGNGEPDVARVVRLIRPAAKGRLVLTNSAALAYYLRDLRPHLDRPFGLQVGMESSCVASCRASFLIVDDTRVANSPRIGRGQAHAFGPVYVRATPQVAGVASVEKQGDMGSLACSLALLIASSLGGVGTAHPMEVTVQDDALFLHQPPAAVQRTAKRLAGLGADRVRLTAGWSVLEPQRGKFSEAGFRALDTAVKAATAAGLKTQIDLAFWAPKWAVKRQLHGADAARQRWRPDPVAFGQFVTAVARHYNGVGKVPAVRLWTTWNEPNHPTFLLPQSERTRSGGWRDVAPQIYRAMHEAGYNALKQVNQQNMVLIGGLSSRGARQPGPDRNIPPLRFIRDMACVDDHLRPLRDPACRGFHPLQADGFSYHPYSFEAAPDVVYGGPDTVHLGDLNRLGDLLHQLHAMGRITTDLPLYLTEFGYESKPPDNGRGVPPETQARYMSLGSFLAWRNPDTRMFAQFLFQDISDPRSYQTGLLYPDGESKPALQAFKLPFWAQAQEQNGQSFVLIWGQVRPGSGSQSVALEIQHPDGTWHTIPSVAAAPKGDGRDCPTEDQQFLTDQDGFYLRLLPYQGIVTYRARWMRPDGGTDYAPPVTVGLPTPG